MSSSGDVVHCKKRKRKQEKHYWSPLIAKYWKQRYSLFSLYDKGIAMDEVGWFSVTPESIAQIQARRVLGRCEESSNLVVIDCFAGVGGNAIQFAKTCDRVIAIEIDPVRVEHARNNARVYGVEDKIEFVVGDFFTLAPFLKGDVLFLSPPWGGPSYSKIESFTLDLLKPKDGYSLFQVAQSITPNIIMFLPRNVDVNEVEQLSWLSSPPLNMDIEKNYVGKFFKGITVYFGSLAKIYKAKKKKKKKKKKKEYKTLQAKIEKETEFGGE
ncbi:Trimethylguanosine synthase [Zostera marina]|uniref:Trimethylguanosine synthase n=1 Tax=Zostera marina TaxID=29655 RepID=A0A0K9Q2R6_ZOSMR|nr:Trimethylguanosine synthase [Zostera marina]